MVTIIGTVPATGKYLITGTPISSPNPGSLIKLTFENNTAGTNVALLAGTQADFNNGTGTQLSDSGGPGFVFLSIVDSATLNGKILYAKREVGTAAAHFTLNID
jgi:hypothetical protein